MHDFSKPQPHVASQKEVAKKRKLPIYILVIVGIFLIALLISLYTTNFIEPLSYQAFSFLKLRALS